MDTDGTDKWEGDAADFAIAHSSKVLGNAVVFVVPKSTPRASHAAYPTQEK